MADSLAGQFTGNTGSIHGSVLSAQTAYFIKSGSSLNWGIYDFPLGYGNSYTGKPSGDAAWSASVGGHGQFIYEDNPEGYGVGSIASTGISWTDEGEINASLTGNYLTLERSGTLGGPFKGTSTATNGTDGT